MDFESDHRLVFCEEILGNGWSGRHIEIIYLACLLRSTGADECVRPYVGTYGRFASGALKYFSIGISKYISSWPLASFTPIR